MFIRIHSLHTSIFVTVILFRAWQKNSRTKPETEPQSQLLNASVKTWSANLLRALAIPDGSEGMASVRCGATYKGDGITVVVEPPRGPPYSAVALPRGWTVAEPALKHQWSPKNQHPLKGKVLLHVAYAIGGVNGKGIAPLKLGCDACAVPIFISVVPAHVKSPLSTTRCIWSNPSTEWSWTPWKAPQPRRGWRQHRRKAARRWRKQWPSRAF